MNRRRVLRLLAIVVTVAALLSIFASVLASAGTVALGREALVDGDMELVTRITGDAEALALHGDHLYAAIDSRLVVVDVSDPARPTIVGQTDVFPGYVEDVAWADSRIYLANHSYGVRIIDVSMPSAPTELGVCDTPGNAYGVAASGDYVYVADECSRFQVCDVSTPSTSAVVGSYTNLEGCAYGVAISSDYAYVGAWHLYVLDLSNPEAPTYAGSYVPDSPEGYSRKGVTVVDDRLFVGEYRYTLPDADGGGLRVIDISDPTDPTALGFYGSPSGQVDGLAVAGDRVYVADGWGGVRVVDVSDPSVIREVGAYDTTGDAEKVGVSGNYVFVADSEDGLLTLWFAEPITSVVPTSGASIISALDGTGYLFPAGTFTESVVFTHTAQFAGTSPSPGELAGIGHLFEATATYTSTGHPAEVAPGKSFTITVEYLESELGPAIEASLGIYWWDEASSEWTQHGITSTVDPAADLVFATVNHLSTFSVLGETHRVFIPLTLRSY